MNPKKKDTSTAPSGTFTFTVKNNPKDPRFRALNRRLREILKQLHDSKHHGHPERPIGACLA